MLLRLNIQNEPEIIYVFCKSLAKDFERRILKAQIKFKNDPDFKDTTYDVFTSHAFYNDTNYFIEDLAKIDQKEKLKQENLEYSELIGKSAKFYFILKGYIPQIAKVIFPKDIANEIERLHLWDNIITLEGLDE